MYGCFGLGYTAAMLGFRKKYRIVILAFALVFILFVSFSGIVHASADGMSEGKTGCLLMLESMIICAVHPLEHISAWQNMFTAVFQPDLSLASLLLAALMLAHIWMSLRKRFTLSAIVPVRRMDHEYISVVSPLQEAFANGIIHSKAF